MLAKFYPFLFSVFSLLGAETFSQPPGFPAPKAPNQPAPSIPGSGNAAGNPLEILKGAIKKDVVESVAGYPDEVLELIFEVSKHPANVLSLKPHPTDQKFNRAAAELYEKYPAVLQNLREYPLPTAALGLIVQHDLPGVWKIIDEWRAQNAAPAANIIRQSGRSGAQLGATTTNASGGLSRRYTTDSGSTNNASQTSSYSSGSSGSSSSSDNDGAADSTDSSSSSSSDTSELTESIDEYNETLTETNEQLEEYNKNISDLNTNIDETQAKADEYEAKAQAAEEKIQNRDFDLSDEETTAELEQEASAAREKLIAESGGESSPFGSFASSGGAASTLGGGGASSFARPGNSNKGAFNTAAFQRRSMSQPQFNRQMRGANMGMRSGFARNQTSLNQRGFSPAGMGGGRPAMRSGSSRSGGSRPGGGMRAPSGGGRRGPGGPGGPRRR